MLHLIPARLHRAILPVAHRVRHHWRRIVRRPLQGVSVIVTNEAGWLLLVRHSYGRPAWSLPGGGIGRGEHPAQTAHRELREELGSEPSELELVTVIEDRISGAPHSAHIFAARLVGAICPDGREVIAAEFFAIENLPEDLSPLARRNLAAWREWLAN